MFSGSKGAREQDFIAGVADSLSSSVPGRGGGVRVFLVV